MTLRSPYTILSLDTSCDETSVAITQGLRVLGNIIASQVEIHRRYGGVYPTAAKRAHQQNIDPAIGEAFKRANIALRRNFTQNFKNIPPQDVPSPVLSWPHIHALAVTIGPGLAPALEVGIKKARQLATKYQKPLIAVNHMEGHLLSCLAQNSRGKGGYANISPHFLPLEQDNLNCHQGNAVKKPGSKKILDFSTGSNNNSLLSQQKPKTSTREAKVRKLGRVPKPPDLDSEQTSSSNHAVFPALALLVSGGHTQLVLISRIGDYQLLGETRDDAAGECFDKVARLLGLGYPGGPIIAELAKKGDPSAYSLPIPMKTDPSLDFSFSGLKTACKYFLQANPLSTQKQIQDFCASFQATVIKALFLKLQKAIPLHHPRTLWLGGGVGANWQLRRRLRQLARQHHLPLFTPYASILFTDNAAMIGIAAYFQALRGDFVRDPSALDRLPNLSL